MRAFFKGIIITLLVLLALGIGTIVLLPTLVSSRWGLNFVLWNVNQQIPGKLGVENIDLSWFGTQHVEKLHLYDVQGREILTVPSFIAEVPLWDLIWSPMDITRLKLEKGSGVLVVFPDQTTNFHRALDLTLAETPFPKISTAPLFFHDVDATIDLSPQARDSIMIHVDGQTQQDSLQGHFAFQLAVNPSAPYPEVQAHVENFPLKAIEELLTLNNPEERGALIPLLGDSLSLTLTQVPIAPTTPDSKPASQLNLKGSTTTLNFGGKATVTKTDNEKAWAFNSQGYVALSNQPRTVFISSGHIPRDSDGEMDIVIDADEIPLNPLYTWTQGAFPFEKARVEHIHLHRFSKKGLPTAYTLHAHLELGMAANDPRALLVPSALLIDGTGEATTDSSLWDIQLTSPIAKAVANVKWVPNTSTIYLTTPSQLSYKIQPKVLMQLGWMDDKLPHLSEPAVLEVIVDPFEMQLSNIDPSSLMLKGNASLDRVRIQGGKYDVNATVEGLNIPWEWNGKRQRVQLTFTGQTYLNNKQNPGTLAGVFTLTGGYQEGYFDISKAAIEAKVDIASFPVAVLGGMLQQEELPALIGSTIDVHFHTSSNPTQKEAQVLNFAFNGEQINGKIALDLYSDKITTEHGSSQILWTLTPERFATLLHMLKSSSSSTPLPMLGGSADLKLTIRQLLLPKKEFTHNWEGRPYPKPKSFFAWTQSAFHGVLEIPSIDIQTPTNQEHIVWQPITLTMDSDNISESVQLVGQFHTASTTAIDINAKIKDLFLPSGELRIDQAMVQAHAVGHDLPSVLLCQIACLPIEVQQQIDAILGDHFSGEGHAKISQGEGPFQLKVKGPLGRLSADALLHPAHISLTAPLEVEVTMSPKLSKSVLEDLMPFLSSATGAEAPVRIVLDPQDFILPLMPVRWTEINLNKGTVALGKMSFSNEGKLAEVIELFKKGSSSQSHTIWFTPLYFDMHKGVLSIQRFDMLIDNNLPIAMWGQITFPKDRVNLTIGLTAEALENALGIKGLDKKEMLLVPLKGTLENASIDKATATARISALVAHTQGGPKGLILGSILDILGGGLKDQQRIPAPTTQPFPWENQQSHDERNYNRSNRSSTKQLFKSLKKEASSFLGM